MHPVPLAQGSGDGGSHAGVWGPFPGEPSASLKAGSLLLRAAHLRSGAGGALRPYQMGHGGNILFLLLEEEYSINSN